MPEIELDEARCTGCGLCVDFCPVEVFDMVERDQRTFPQATRVQDCWACDTCVGQCPTGALRVVQAPLPVSETVTTNMQGGGNGHGKFAPGIDQEERKTYAAWTRTLMSILRLRWNPVAITLVPAGSAMPPVPQPRVKLRYCQSLMAARRGKSLLMPASCHACPDGTNILGLTEIPRKLASGELYIRFGKLDSVEAARQMIAERPHLEARSIQATLVTPLQEAVVTPDVVAVIAQPEQMMWLCMAASYYTGRRFNFKVSGYNAQCVETTLIPYTTQEINISLGCYGCRASSDISDDLMFMGIPLSQMPGLVKGLEQLGKKAIPNSRDKIYLPPLT
jgi:uncharacterized protein (DUF169 family)/NAD-dependent dihydropyrimidine dehydrogenase PreA subunit